MKNYNLSMNQLALVIGLLFFLITAIPLTLAQVDDDSALDFRFTWLMSDKSLYESGEVKTCYQMLSTHKRCNRPNENVMPEGAEHVEPLVKNYERRCWFWEIL